MAVNAASNQSEFAQDAVDGAISAAMNQSVVVLALLDVVSQL
jgi:hypothetical protein